MRQPNRFRLPTIAKGMTRRKNPANCKYLCMVSLSARYLTLTCLDILILRNTITVNFIKTIYCVTDWLDDLVIRMILVFDCTAVSQQVTFCKPAMSTDCTKLCRGAICHPDSHNKQNPTNTTPLLCKL